MSSTRSFPRFRFLASSKAEACQRIQFHIKGTENLLSSAELRDRAPGNVLICMKVSGSDGSKRHTHYTTSSVKYRVSANLEWHDNLGPMMMSPSTEISFKVKSRSRVCKRTTILARTDTYTLHTLSSMQGHTDLRSMIELSLLSKTGFPTDGVIMINVRELCTSTSGMEECLDALYEVVRIGQFSTTGSNTLQRLRATHHSAGALDRKTALPDLPHDDEKRAASLLVLEVEAEPMDLPIYEEFAIATPTLPSNTILASVDEGPEISLESTLVTAEPANTAQSEIIPESNLDTAHSADLSTPASTMVPTSPLTTQPPSSLTVGTVMMRFKALLSMLLAEVSAAPNTGQNGLGTTLMEYASSLQSLDPVTSLVRCREYRANLLQVASALNIFDGMKIREALQADEHEIADTLNLISHSEIYRPKALVLEGDEAQQFLDIVQDVLDKGYLLNEDDRIKVRKLLVKLSETCDKLPSSLFIEGVTELDTQVAFVGGFGDVFRASYNGTPVALKRMRIFQKDGPPNIRRRFCREALLWQHLDNEFIVPFLGIDAQSFPSFICMVSPWMRCGTSLRHLAENGRVGIDKRLYEVSQGLAYLHSRRIVHGDLRGSNILINEKWQACLTDFGLAVLNDATASFTSSREGSVRWMAPELHVPESFGLDRFRLTPETDIYSFGCVCVEFYTGQRPFPTITHDSAVMMKVIRGERPERPSGESAMSDQLWQAVEMCWSHYFADRLKTEDVVEALRQISSPQPSDQSIPLEALIDEQPIVTVSAGGYASPAGDIQENTSVVEPDASGGKNLSSPLVDSSLGDEQYAKNDCDSVQGA